MTGEPIKHEDPLDPQVILRDLPEREHAAFLAQYHEAAQEAADDPADYPRLAACLRMWSIKARIMPQVLAERPDFYDEVDAEFEAVRNGTAKTVPIEDALAQVMGISRAEAEQYWADRVAAARAAKAERRSA